MPQVNEKALLANDSTAYGIMRKLRLMGKIRMHEQANEATQQVLDQLIEQGKEVGVQVAAYLGEDLVVDAWAGMADPATGLAVAYCHNRMSVDPPGQDGATLVGNTIREALGIS